MFRTLLGRLFARRVRRVRSTRPVAARRPGRLGVEVLEGREVPAVLTVNSLSDTISANNVLTLREALSLNAGTLLFSQLSAAEKAQVSGTVGVNDRIRFAVNGSINLNSDLPTINKSLAIEGPGADKLTINGGNLHRPFTVGANGDVFISGLRLFQGHSADSGGGVLNNGKLSLSRVEIDHCTSDKHGAGIENNGNLTVDECYIHDNTAAKVGGAIDNNATAKVTNSTLSTNIAGNNGGAIWSDGTLTLANVTLAYNKAVNFGGALRLTDGTAVITSCTIVHNQADTDGTTFESGGGISIDGATVTLNNTVVTNNTRNLATVRDDVNGAANGQFNFIGVNTGLTGISNGALGNQVGTNASPLNPQFGAFDDNGGFAPTFTPKQGSPLLAAGASTLIAGLTDQRGAGRRSAGATIGAVEVVNPLSPVGVSRLLFGPGANATADQAFVKGLYRACLLRDADAGGLQAWLNFLSVDPIGRRSAVVHGFYNSQENRAAQVTFFYRYFLSREPDAAGLNGWVAALQSGADEAAVMRGFLLSDEFTGKADNAGFVNTLYYALLGRNADPAGFAGWKNALDTNALSRGQMADQFLRATETVNRVVTSFHQSYLNTEPSVTLLNTQTTAIQVGFTFGSVAEVVLGSSAFYSKAAASVGP